MDDIKNKQQVVDKIKGSTNILITVSNSPSVDALSAMLGLSLLLDKLDKHATAVFSGEVPPAINFLQPEKTFENTTDSLRDFIIALNKEKADHLRYKVEGDMVKIFITPYRTTITQNDLEFSQGDYNVELVLALGVDNQDHLDAALESHGRILHDATTVTITAGEQTSDLGGIDWHDSSASSLSEMVTTLADSLKDEKGKSLLDDSIATAFLTGIVAETDRFSNSRTTSKVMTVASQLMAAGADQQLVAAKLQENHEIQDNKRDKTELTVDRSEPEQPKEAAETTSGLSPDLLNIAHDQTATLADIDRAVKEAEQQEAAEEANRELESVQEPKAEPPVEPQPEAAEVHPAYAVEEPQPATPAPESTAAATSELPDGEPSLGGTLNATTEEAAEDSRKALDDDRNKTILTHSSYIDTPPAPINAASGGSGEASSDAGAGLYSPSPTEELEGPKPELVITPPDDLTQAASQLAQPAAPVAINPVYAFDQTPQPSPMPGPVPTPSSLGLPMPPATPDFSAPPVGAPINPVYAPEAPAAAPERLGDIFPAGAPTQPVVTPPAPITPPNSTIPPANDPGQFQIPGAPQQ